MDQFSPSDLKAILHSKRANLYYLEYCQVMQKDGRVLCLTEATKENLYFNIPIANATVILLGNGASIAQAAIRMLAQAGVLVGFCGGGNTPQNEYRLTEYLQGWMGFWFDDSKRLAAAKTFQNALNTFFTRTEKATNSQELLLTEAQLTKVLYKFAANATQAVGFNRQHQSTSKVDMGKANDFLNHGNYLAYWLAA